MFAMIFSPARKRKTPRTQRVHKFYGDEGGRKISRIDTGFVYEYRFLVMRRAAKDFWRKTSSGVTKHCVKKTSYIEHD
jgi:hypothetical protein